MKKSIHTKEQKALVARLKKARLDAGLTQIQVAKKLGSTQSYISKVEAGELKVDVIELKRFANIYGKSVDSFIR